MVVFVSLQIVLMNLCWYLNIYVHVGVTDRIHALEDRSQKLHEYFDLCNDVTHTLSKFEDKVASHNALGPAAKDTRYLHKVQALQEEVELVKPQLEYLRDLADNLTRSASPTENTKQILSRIDELKDRYDELKDDLDEAVDEIESGSHVVAQFQVSSVIFPV